VVFLLPTPSPVGEPVPIKVRFKMNVAWYVVGEVIECERDAKTEELIRMGVIEQVEGKTDGPSRPYQLTGSND